VARQQAYLEELRQQAEEKKARDARDKAWREGADLDEEVGGVRESQGAREPLWAGDVFSGKVPRRQGAPEETQGIHHSNSQISFGWNQGPAPAASPRKGRARVAPDAAHGGQGSPGRAGAYVEPEAREGKAARARRLRREAEEEEEAAAAAALNSPGGGGALGGGKGPREVPRPGFMPGLNELMGNTVDEAKLEAEERRMEVYKSELARQIQEKQERKRREKEEEERYEREQEERIRRELLEEARKYKHLHPERQSEMEGDDGIPGGLGAGLGATPRVSADEDQPARAGVTAAQLRKERAEAFGLDEGASPPRVRRSANGPAMRLARMEAEEEARREEEEERERQEAERAQRLLAARMAAEAADAASAAAERARAEQALRLAQAEESVMLEAERSARMLDEVDLDRYDPPEAGRVRRQEDRRPRRGGHEPSPRDFDPQLEAIEASQRAHEERKAQREEARKRREAKAEAVIQSRKRVPPGIMGRPPAAGGGGRAARPREPARAAPVARAPAAVSRINVRKAALVPPDESRPRWAREDRESARAHLPSPRRGGGGGGLGTEAVEMLREMREEQQRLRDEVMQLRREASQERAELVRLRAQANADASPRAGGGGGGGYAGGAAAFAADAHGGGGGGGGGGNIPKAQGGLLNKRHPTGNVRAVADLPTPR